ncbi:MAG: insulinase family protein, partial [Candidatus Dadabacteria bacterium]
MKRLFLIIFFLFFLSKAFFPQPALAEDPFKEFQKKVFVFKAPNGLRVIFYKRAVAPVFTGYTAVGVGGIDEKPGSTGIAHLLEHIAFKGTKTVGKKNYKKEKKLLKALEKLMKTHPTSPQVKEIRAKLSKLWLPEEFTKIYKEAGAVGLNATTSADRTSYFVSLPKDAFKLWCYMESDRIINPVMRQFYKEREVVREERRMRYEDSPDGKLWERLKQVAFLAHPYRLPVIGYDEDIRKLQASQLKAFQKKYYKASNIVMALVGDLSKEEIKECINTYLIKIPEGTRPKRDYIKEPEQNGERVFTLNLFAKPELVIAYKRMPYPHPDDAAFTVLVDMLSGGASSWLYEELVNKEKVATKISYAEGPGYLGKTLAMFWITPASSSNNSPFNLLKRFDKALLKFRKEGITKERLKRSITRTSVDYIKQLKSNQGLAQLLAETELLYGGWQEIVNSALNLKKVTLSDVKRVFDKYLI